jgi:hypothetical protein
MPGITKILLISQDFPQLNLSPDNKIFQEVYKINIINQVSQIFVYEDLKSTQARNNKALRLIQELEEHPTTTIHEIHAIRKEFLKKIFAAHVK